MIGDFILSAEGVRQGCDIWSLLFVLSMNEIFAKFQDSVSGVHTVAIIDDFYILGTPAKVIQVFKILQELCEDECSLDLNMDKSFFVDFHDGVAYEKACEEVASIGV